MDVQPHQQHRVHPVRKQKPDVAGPHGLPLALGQAEPRQRSVQVGPGQCEQVRVGVQPMTELLHFGNGHGYSFVHATNANASPAR